MAEEKKVGRRGIKTCPKCNKSVGARTCECVCGHIFKARKSPPIKAKDPNVRVASRGKQFCPSCDKEVGRRAAECECGHIFYERKTPKKVVSKTSRKKTCPDCGNKYGFSQSECECGYNFTLRMNVEKAKAAREAKRLEPVPEEEIKKSEINEKRRAILSGPDILVGEGHEEKKMTKKEHAERILGYGKKRAFNLLRISTKNNYWAHVDWGYVKEQLEVANG